MESLHKFTDVCSCIAYASIPRTVHYLYAGVRHYGEGTRGHKLARVSLRRRPSANIRKVHTYTRYKVDVSLVIASRLPARCLTPNVTHLNYGVYSRSLQRYDVNLTSSVSLCLVSYAFLDRLLYRASQI